jgi:tetratricopeptide (TPR) repeat protein
MLELVDHLVGFSAGAPILILCLARPELFEIRPDWSVPSPARVVIALPPLPEGESRGLAEHLEAARAMSEQARERAVENAEGNPLFLEQLVAFESEGGNTALPPGIHALLAARIDRLDPGERAVLERAAIEGRRFHRPTVLELLPTEERPKLDQQLLALIRKDFVEGQGADAFRFRHILLRDAAYEATPKEKRAALHEQYAEWLEAGRDVDEIIGYHFEQAAQLRHEIEPLCDRATELAARAADRLASAGRAALNRGDVHGAANLLARAVALLSARPTDRLQLLPDLAEALSSTGEFTEAEAVLTEAAEGASATNDKTVEWRVRLQRAWLRLETDPNVDVDEVFDEANLSLAAFAGLHDDRALAHAWHLIAWVQMTSGHLSALTDAVRQGRARARAVGNALTEEELTVWGLLAGPTGPVPASELIVEAETEYGRARANGSRRAESAALLVLATCLAFQGHFAEARARLAEATSIDKDLGSGRGSGFQYTPAGMIELLAGDVTAAERELRAGYDLLRERGDAWFLCGVAAELADVLWLQGRDDEAFELTLVSENTVGRGVLVAQMMWRGARAKVLARRGQLDEAEALAREAVAIIETTEYVLYRADALTDLAEVLRLMNRSDEAATTAEEARRLYETKGNVAAVRNLERLLDELRAAKPLAR